MVLRWRRKGLRGWADEKRAPFARRIPRTEKCGGKLSVAPLVGRNEVQFSVEIDGTDTNIAVGFAG